MVSIDKAPVPDCSCEAVLDWLEAAAVGAIDVRDERLPAAREHVQTCPSCQAEWRRRQRWTAQLTSAVQATEPPPGLKARLHDLTARAASAELVPVRPRRLARSVIALAACLIFAVAVTFWPRPQPVFTLAELQPALHAEYGLLPAHGGAFVPRLPVGWTPYFDYRPEIVRGFPGASDPAAGAIALIRFQFQRRRLEEPLRGRLLVLPQSQFRDEVLATSFASAEVRYLDHGRAACAFWAEDGLVFVCLMPSGPADLQRLQQAMAPVRSLT